MRFRRFRKLVAAYGGDPSRWPADERDAALRFVRTSARARALVDDASRLDAVLARAPAAPADAALRDAVLDIPGRVRPVMRQATDRRRHWGRIWAPAAALAAAGLFGFAVGMTNVLPTAGPDEATDIAALVYGIDDIDEVMP